MTTSSISNIFCSNYSQFKEKTQHQLQLIKEIPLVKKIDRISNQIKESVIQVCLSKDPGEGLLFASKLGMTAKLLSPSGIFNTHEKWSLAAGYGTTLLQSRKLGSYYEQLIKYPDELESYWSKKLEETSLSGRVMMYLPRHLSTFSIRVTAVALETLIEVTKACAKSVKDVAKEEISKRITESSNKDTAVLVAQVVGTALISLPTAYYFSQTVSNGLKTIGSAVLAYESLNFLKDRSIEALKIDYNAHTQSFDESYKGIRNSFIYKKAIVLDWLQTGSPMQQNLKKTSLIAIGTLAASILIPTIGFSIYNTSKVSIKLLNIALPIAMYTPNAIAAFKFLDVAFQKPSSPHIAIA